MLDMAATDTVAGRAFSAMLGVWVQVPALQAVWHFGGQVAAVFGT
jgi:hypothetical protein